MALAKIVIYRKKTGVCYVIGRRIRQLKGKGRAVAGPQGPDPGPGWPTAGVSPVSLGVLLLLPRDC